VLILLKSIHYKSFKSNILNCHRVLVCLFNKMCIKLSKVLVYLFNKMCIKLSKSAYLSIQQDVYQATEECLFIYLTRYILSCSRMLILLELNWQWISIVSMLKSDLSQISKVSEFNYHHTLKVCTFSEKLLANLNS